MSLPTAVDVLDVWTGRLSWRRLRVILDNLPPESAYCTAVRNSLGEDDLQAAVDSRPDTEHGPWSQTDYLLARVGDAVEYLIWMQSDGKTPPPEPLPRPGVPARGNVRAINETAEAYLREVERLHGAQPAPDWKPPETMSGGAGV